MQFLATLEGAVLVVDRRKRHVAGAGNVARGDPRTRIGFAAIEPGRTPGVDDRKRESGENLLLRDDFLRPLGSVERDLAPFRLPDFDRASFRGPFLEAAIEDRDLRSKVAEHEPAARRRPDRRVVIDDDSIVAGDSDLFHRAGEVFATRKHVRRGVGRVANRVDVEEAGAGDMGAQIFLAAVAAAGRHEPAGVDDG